MTSTAAAGATASPLVEPPKVEYVALTHRDDSETDRVVVRIEARIKDYVVDAYGTRIKRAGRLSETVRVREFWTLAAPRRPLDPALDRAGRRGAHALQNELIATPWSDETGMRDEALVQGAVADAVPEGMSIAEVADLDFSGDARAAALDLSLADGRFSPDVLEIAARRAVAAWAEAIDGADDALLALAQPAAAREMLHPGDPTKRTRLVVRGPTVRQIRILALDAAAEPPTMTLEVDLEGRRYLEDRDTAAVVAGNQARATRFTEKWTLALEGDAAQPWRIATVAAPVGQP